MKTDATNESRDSSKGENTYNIQHWKPLFHDSSC